jgi:hypothetical protein
VRVFTRIHSQRSPAWEGFFAIFVPAVDLMMDVPR